MSLAPLPYPAPAEQAAARSGAADIVYVLCLLQAAFVLLAGFGEALLMGGNGGYVLLPLVKVIVLAWLASKAVSRRRWAVVTLIVLQGITLAGFLLQLAIALVPGLALTLNLVGLTTNLALPVTVIILCGRILRERSPAGPTTVPTVLLPAQDPFAPAPIIDPTTAARMIERDEAAAVPGTHAAVVPGAQAVAVPGGHAAGEPARGSMP